MNIQLHHRNVNVVKRLKYDKSRFLMFGMNLGIGKMASKSKLLYIWDSKRPPQTLEDEFFGGVTTNFNGHKFTGIVLAFNYMAAFCKMKVPITLDKQKPGKNDPKSLGCRGDHISFYNHFSEAYNLTYGLVSPGVSWGFQYDNETGRYTGTFALLYYGIGDFSVPNRFSAPTTRFCGGINNIIRSISLDIIAPIPQKISNAFALLYPFEPKLWPFVIASTILMSIAFVVVP